MAIHDGVHAISLSSIVHIHLWHIVSLIAGFFKRVLLESCCFLQFIIIDASLLALLLQHILQLHLLVVLIV